MKFLKKIQSLYDKKRDVLFKKYLDFSMRLCFLLHLRIDEVSLPFMC